MANYADLRSFYLPFIRLADRASAASPLRLAHNYKHSFKEMLLNKDLTAKRVGRSSSVRGSLIGARNIVSRCCCCLANDFHLCLLLLFPVVHLSEGRELVICRDTVCYTCVVATVERGHKG